MVETKVPSWSDINYKRTRSKSITLHLKFTDYSNKNAGHFGWNVSGKINLTFANGRPVRKEGSSWKKGISERKIPTPLTNLNMNYSLSLRRPQKWNTHILKENIIWSFECN